MCYQNVLLAKFLPRRNKTYIVIENHFPISLIFIPNHCKHLRNLTFKYYKRFGNLYEIILQCFTAYEHLIVFKTNFGL